MGALRVTSVSALTAEADNDLQECEVLLRRAIEMVRGPAHRSPTRSVSGSRPSRVVHIHHDPYDAAYIATDATSGLSVLRHQDGARLRAMCTRIGWQVASSKTMSAA
jgi:hypothetical protein